MIMPAKLTISGGFASRAFMIMEALNGKRKDIPGVSGDRL